MTHRWPAPAWGWGGNRMAPEAACVFAEVGINLRRERQMEGIAAAKARGGLQGEAGNHRGRGGRQA